MQNIVLDQMKKLPDRSSIVSSNEKCEVCGLRECNALFKDVAGVESETRRCSKRKRRSRNDKKIARAIARQ